MLSVKIFIANPCQYLRKLWVNSAAIANIRKPETFKKLVYLEDYNFENEA